MIVETDLAYLAGLVDGEGSIIIHKYKQQLYKSRGNGKRSDDKTPRFVVDLRVAMSDSVAIYWIKDKFGGSVTRVEDKRKTQYRPMYYWTTRANKASDLLKILLPYLKTKRPQAFLCIAFQDNLIKKTGWKGIGISEEELTLRNNYYEINKLFNSGFNPDYQEVPSDYREDT